MSQPPAAWPPSVPPPSSAPTWRRSVPEEQPVPPARRGAWRDALHRSRRAATTEPGRLRGLGAVLALLLLCFGALTAWQVSERASAADAVIDRSQPLSENAAHLYRSLADADTTAADGFLAGGEASRTVRERYVRDIRRASELLAKAAADSESSGAADREIAELNRELPHYTGLVGAAQADNRQGLPLGGAYLRYANEQMHEKLLPSARDLHRAETARLRADQARARSWPWAATAAGILALGALGAAQRRHYLRTNRVLSPGLVGATAATLLALLWLTAATALARSSLDAADEQGARSLHVLNEAWTGSLQARGAENMWLVTRGAGGLYEERSVRLMERVAGPESGESRTPDGLLGEALELADDPAGRKPVETARRALHDWRARHREAAAAEDAGDYAAAVARVTGREADTTGEAFDRVSTSLREASAHEQAEFATAASDGRAALTGLAAGAAVLAVLGTAGVLFGIGRGLAEYR
ncbi:hypothetical protein [Streptomyces sp. TR06-5]|uniref:hypothetical protein n=1 Tax=unclassified Streptomyces TaxID=2593676 RepID=UPI0039A31255